jgi:ketosteroid isomerase-like protein
VNASENKDLVLSFFTRLRAGKIDEALKLWDDEATWWVAGDPHHVAIGGTYTKANVLDLLRKVHAAMPSELALTITSVVADEHRVVIEANPHGTSPAGEIYDNRNVFVVDVSSGRIQAIREYYDTMHTSAVFFGTTYATPDPNS